ncbi:MAG TPA: hypothetical protein VGB38_09705 [bacterium]
MRYKNSILVCALVLQYGLTCEKGPLSPPFPSMPFYFNSFESADDANGWNGVEENMFVEDPAPNSGKQSLHIGGGCIQPTAWKVFPKAEADARYALSCWGKIDQENQSGEVVLMLDGDERFSSETVLSVNSREWTFYGSEKSLFCPKGRSLRLEFRVGGIIFASMAIDVLTVERL